MQADQSEAAPVRNLPIHTKARLPASTEPKRPVIGRKLRAALRKIVWNGLDIAEAAQAADYKPISLRIALAKPHVKRALQEERDVFIAEARGQNIHHAVKIRSGDNAAAAMRAVDFIERVGAEPAAGASTQSAPGMVVVVVNADKPLNVNTNSPRHELQITATEQRTLNEPLTPHDT